MKFNQEFIYPRHALPPEWVSSRLDNFHKTLKNDTEKYSSINALVQLQNSTIDNIEKNILPKGIKITKVLDKKGIAKLIDSLDKTIQSGIEFMWYYYLIMQAGFTLSSVLPSSFSPEALILPQEFLTQKAEAVRIYNNSKKTTEDLSIEQRKDLILDKINISGINSLSKEELEAINRAINSK